MQITVRTRSWKTLLAAAVMCACSSESINGPSQTLASVTVSLSATSIGAGQTAQASAVLRDDAGNSFVVQGDTVRWASSNPGVATVSSIGLVTGISQGTTSITATLLNKSGSAAITVAPAAAAPVAVVSIGLSAQTVFVQGTTLATATLFDALGVLLSGRSISWSSANPGIAAISSTGVITGVAVGTVTITATSEGKVGSTTITVIPTPPVPVATVAVTVAASTFRVSESSQATAVLRDVVGNVLVERPVSWATSNPEIITVSANGLVTGRGVGTATITATSEGRSGSTTVIVTQAVVGSVAIALTPGVTVGGGAQAVALVFDPSSAIMTGVPVTWASANTAVATVSPSGFVVGVAVGTTFITATAGSVSATATLIVTVAGPAPPSGTQLAVTRQPVGSVNAQPLSVQPIVQVRDAANALVTSFVPVQASLATGAGTLAGTTTVVSVNGTATFTNLAVVGSGAFTLQFTSPALAPATSASFTMTALATQLVVATQPAGVVSTIPFGTQPVVHIRDASNVTVPGASASVVASLASGTGTLSGTTTVTAVNGVAAFTNLAISGAGPHTLRFTSGALPQATTASFNVTSSETQLAVVAQPSGAVSTVVLTGQPVVEVRSVSNTVVPGSTVPVTASIASGSGVLSGTTTVAAVNGIATFTNLTVVGAGPHTLQFTSGSLAAATSGSFTVQAAPATRLGIRTQPGGAASTLAFSTQPVVEIRDVLDAVVNTSVLTVTASLASGTGTLSGTTTITAINGVATFSNLLITGTGPFALNFTSGALTPAVSSTFSVGPPPPSQLAVATQPSTTAFGGFVLAQQPAIQLRDASNAAASVAGVVVTASIETGTGTLGGTTTATTNASGIAVFTNLTLSGNGAHTMRFTAAGLTAATSTSIAVVALHLSVTSQPSSSAQSGVAFPMQPVVQLRDPSNNAVSLPGLVITASLASGGPTLSGTLSGTSAANGAVAFNGLTISGTVGARTIAFSTPNVTGISSSSVTITPGPAAALQVVTQPPVSSAASAPFTTQPSVQVVDLWNNAVSVANVRITAALTGGNGTLIGVPRLSTNSSGRVTFPNLGAIDNTGSTATLIFSAPGFANATSSNVVLTAPAAVSDEPVFDAAVGTLIMRDDMNQYVSIAAMGAGPLGTTPRIIPNPSPILNSLPVSNHNQIITPGRDGTGQALRMAFSGIDQDAATFQTSNSPTAPTLATHNIRYYARVNMAGTLTTELSTKWFMAWHFTGDRAQWDIHNRLPCTLAGVNPNYWQFYDKSRGTTCQGNQPVGPYIENVIDNKWHRYTYSYRPNTSAGARDGFAKMWVDGIKIIDVSAATIGVTPAFGEKPWCLADDVDAITVADGIQFLMWGSVQTSTTAPWTKDIDDLLWWRT